MLDSRIIRSSLSSSPMLAKKLLYFVRRSIWRRRENGHRFQRRLIVLYRGRSLSYGRCVVRCHPRIPYSFEAAIALSKSCRTRSSGLNKMPNDLRVRLKMLTILFVGRHEECVIKSFFSAVARLVCDREKTHTQTCGDTLSALTIIWDMAFTLLALSAAPLSSADWKWL